MKYLIRLLWIAAVAVAAGYVGIWVFFIPGVENIVDGISADPANGGLIAWGLVQTLWLASLVPLGIILVGSLLAVWIGLGGSQSNHRRRSGMSARQVELEWDRLTRDDF